MLSLGQVGVSVLSTQTECQSRDAPFAGARLISGGWCVHDCCPSTWSRVRWYDRYVEWSDFRLTHERNITPCGIPHRTYCFAAVQYLQAINAAMVAFINRPQSQT